MNQHQTLHSIATGAKRLLLSDAVKDATPEVMNLCELVERHEEAYGELAPELKPHNKKPWYASYKQRGQVAELQEMIYLSSQESARK